MRPLSRATMSNQNLSHPRILVVDQDATQRELICRTLAARYGEEGKGNVVGVGTAADCLAQDLQRFDIVLQGYHLPDMDGLELLERIVRRCDIPVMLVTGENVFATASDAIRRDAQDYVVKKGDFLFALPILVDKNLRIHEVQRENRRLHGELEAMLDELRVKNLQLEDSLERLQTMATTDHLTGLANRRHFSDVLQRQYEQAVRYQFDLACCMCDLDYYKRLNDTLGHQVGDDLLVMTAGVIQSSLRRSDLAARYGGDEFVLLLPHTSVERASAVADRMRTELAAVSGKDNRLHSPLTMSVGIASLHADHPTSADALVAMADRSLYTAKARGRDRIVTFGESQATVTP